MKSEDRYHCFVRDQIAYHHAKGETLREPAVRATEIASIYISFQCVILSIIGFLLVSCGGTSRVVSLERQYQSMKGAPCDLVIDATIVEGLSKRQMKEEKERRIQAAPQSVLDKYLQDIGVVISDTKAFLNGMPNPRSVTTYNEAEAYLARMEVVREKVLKLANQIDEIDRNYSSEFGKYGLDVYFAFKTKDGIVRVGDAFRNTLYLSDELSKEYLSRVYSSAVSSSYYMNPNIVTVKSYFRKDGTFVPVHLRTAPNKFTIDNYGSSRGR